MRAPLLVLAAALAGLLLIAGCGTPVPAAPKPSPLGGGVATVRADLAGTSNPWVTLADSEIESRGRAVCDALGQYGTKWVEGIADINETTSPRPDETVPDLNKVQTLAMMKASVRGFCPERLDMITW